MDHQEREWLRIGEHYARGLRIVREMAEGFTTPADAMALAAQAMELAASPYATDTGLRALCSGMVDAAHEWLNNP